MENSSRNLAERYPPFDPCAVFMVTGERADSINLDGKLYRLDSLRGTARIFRPKE